MNKPATTSEYISAFPEQTRLLLEQMRATIAAAAPDAQEVISYNMPAFRFHGMLVWYAAHANHIGLYPRGSGVEQFQAKLAPYHCSKGAIQFPYGKPLPLELIGKIVEFRVNENLNKAKNR